MSEYGDEMQYCRFKDFCLNEAWEVGKEITAKPLRDAIRLGAYHFLQKECSAVDGGELIGGFRCPVARCCMTPGFSEGGVGGTDGLCKRENNKKEAHSEPLSEQARIN